MLKTGTVESRENVLPNCLHVDNVNDMVYRHISAILYLTDEVNSFDSDNVALVGGATTFHWRSQFKIQMVRVRQKSFEMECF